MSDRLSDRLSDRSSARYPHDIRTTDEAIGSTRSIDTFLLGQDVHVVGDATGGIFLFSFWVVLLPDCLLKR